MSLPAKVCEALAVSELNSAWGSLGEPRTSSKSSKGKSNDLGADSPTKDISEKSLEVVEVQSFSGQVTRTRWYSTKMFFFDVLGAARQEEQVFDRLACVYRQGAEHCTGVLSTSDVVRYASEIQLGDIIAVSYYRRPLDTSRGERSVEVHSLKVEVSWKEANPDGKQFVAAAEPPPLPKETIETATWKARAPKGELCKFWINSGSCPLRACTLRHVAEEERAAARKAWQEERANRRREMFSKQAADSGDTVALHDKKHKKFRAEALCQWLLEHVGKARMSAGSGVLDIAGGKGEVSRLLHAQGIPCTVIDPRRCPPRNAAAAQQHGPRYVLANFDDALLEDAEHRELLANAAFIVGMHPDQATEPIVDFALERRKPFAVLPCCVFPRQSAVLRTKAGTAPDAERAAASAAAASEDLVVSYPDFVDYLQAKHPKIQRTFLKFQGRNAVLHLFDFPPPAPAQPAPHS